MVNTGLTVHDAGAHFVGCFEAMASPCEVLVETRDRARAERLTAHAMREARRVEAKFSRYRRDNIVHAINESGGRRLEVDTETANLLDYADTCHRLSEGRFDVTCGVLRRAWRFDGSDRVPEPAAVAALMDRVGWQRVRWERPFLTLPAGMEIDLGGIGKEYAVDSTVQILAGHTNDSFVVNFGGDLFVRGPRADGSPWRIGLEDPRRPGTARGNLASTGGGLATSGDARRYLIKDGVRYSHILDPRTGWPVPDAPRSVTVAASSCLEAGMLATFAILHGAGAQAFLEAQSVAYWLG
ncbi:MAG: FAD:protein FMN transferase [Thiohalomonadaceae bacterium]